MPVTQQDELKGVLERASGATKVAVVLFAALIQSWFLLHDEAGVYRRALAEKVSTINARERSRDQKPLRERVRNQLLGRAIDGVAPSDVKEFAGQVLEAKDLQRLWSELSTSPNRNDEWKAKALRSALDAAHREPNARQQRAERRLRIQQAVVRQVSFEFLGLKFAVNGIWAWTVWLIFFTVGVIYLWLERRVSLKVCRNACQPPYLLSTASHRTLPLWVRPLPHPSQWASAVSAGWRQDAAADPLGAICAVLLLICLGLSLDVFRMTALANSLFTGWPIGVDVACNTAINSFALLAIVSIGIQWMMPFVSTVTSADLAASATGVTRRSWLFGGLSGFALASVETLPDCNAKVRPVLFLNSPRFRTQSFTRRNKRRRKPDCIRLPAGFYRDSTGTVIYVPESGTSKLLRVRNKDQFKPYDGHFDMDDLPSVHPKAIVPFARRGVRSILCGVLHREDPSQKAALNRLEDNQKRFSEAFDLVLAALQHSASKRRKGQLPNLQLFDLLAAIALNSENLVPALRCGSPKTTQLAEVRRLLEQAKADFEKDRPPDTTQQPGVNNGEKHSRHERRRQKGNSFQARLTRLVKFQRERSTAWSDTAATAQKAQKTHVVRGWFPEG